VNFNDFIGVVILLAYYLVVCALLPTLLKAWLGVPLELIRKMQHVAYSLSIFLLLNLFSTWYIAVGAAFLLVVVAYPALMGIEKLSIYKKLFVDRAAGGGELRKQLLFVQLCFGLLIFVYWGLLGTHWQSIAAVAVMGWGFGDAAAALIGKAYGKRRVLCRYIEGTKTCEGTLAMILAAGLALFLTMLLYAGLPWYTSLIVAALVAPVAGLVELFSHQGTDTLTVPLTTAAMVLPLILLFNSFGW
jgi:phytol kinase